MSQPGTPSPAARGTHADTTSTTPTVAAVSSLRPVIRTHRTAAHEYRLRYRRFDQGQSKERIFQQRATAERWLLRLTSSTPKGLRPVMFAIIDEREVGQWSQIDSWSHDGDER